MFFTAFKHNQLTLEKAVCCLFGWLEAVFCFFKAQKESNLQNKPQPSSIQKVTELKNICTLK